MDLMNRRRRRGPGGFSLIEALVAAAIFLIIALGLVPLFTRSMISNAAGAESTDVSNFGRSRLEQFYQLPFNSADLTIDAGTEKQFDDYFSFADHTWKTGAAPVGDPASFERTTIIRQYGIGALTDGVLDPDEALPAGEDATFIHLKEIEVNIVASRASGVMGPAKQINLRVLKFK